MTQCSRSSPEHNDMNSNSNTNGTNNNDTTTATSDDSHTENDADTTTSTNGDQSAEYRMESTPLHTPPANATATALKEAPHLGDLMGWRTTFTELPGQFTGLERIVLTANGTLQRIISSYYNAEVTVKIRHNRPRTDQGWYDREVELLIFDQVFCIATSEIHLDRKEYVDLVEINRIGLGQLFRHLNLLPFFHLLKVGRNPEGGLKRTYTLQSPGITCRITETFPRKLFTLLD
ncbi:hypothetical protein SARC_05677 [Sphaeroforma arctica JP610]|uniref:Uncharacterized protein n=1 Tax=Sphaeroforma arctica JP610 TaxID=667725 RepID=A0A0L0FYY7_9EUKA|nr:hypothetical protein SARC_05677 [Sphaeroforma arctica JP610]KNC82040.1 hypothetical protein SARC_05677 [Sphaeroforma arctica JP610]|eukprot:XP_014155942.1 hypothetical protein SARC_05677 [Sphaeroforma arctica JP610]